MIRQRITPAKLIKARESNFILITEFLKCVSRFSTETIWVFEGKDVKYYAPRIEYANEKRPRAIVYAGGKDKVLKLLAYFNNNPELHQTKCAFIVDKDFDQQHPVNPALYVTPTYSVENFYATDTCLARILQGQFDLNCHKSEPIIQKVCRLYKRWVSKFNRASLVFNAWISIQKVKPGYSLNLNNIGIKNIVSLSWNGKNLEIKPLLNLTKIHKMFPDLPKVTATDIKNEISRNFVGDLMAKCRGKYLAEFMYSIIEKLISDARSHTPQFFDKKRTVTLAISKVNLLSDLCVYADTPGCLRTFIASHA